MKTKRILAMLTAILMTGSLSACSGSSGSNSDDSSDSSAPETTSVTDEADTSAADSSAIEMETKDLGKDILLNIDGFDVSVDEYKYYFAYAKNVISSGDDSYWDNDESGEKLDDLKETALSYLFQSYTIYALARDNNVELSDDEKKEIDKQYDQNKMYYELSSNGGNFEDYLKQICCTKEVYRESIVREMLEKKVVRALYEDDFRENYLKDYDHFKLIGVSPKIHYEVDENNDPTDIPKDFYTLNPDLTYTDEEKAVIDKLNGLAKKIDKDGLAAAIPELMNIIKQRLDAGESFDNLITKYSQENNSPVNDDGTYVGFYLPASVVAQNYNSVLDDALSKISDNQYSEPVSSNSTYYIVQKLPFDEDYINKNIINLFMGSEQYPYNTRYQQLYTSLQSDMKVISSPDYNEIKIDYAGVDSEILKQSEEAQDQPQTEEAADQTTAETTAQ